MSDIDLDRLDELYAAATPGEWWEHEDAFRVPSMDPEEDDYVGANFNVLIGDQEDRVCECHHGECNPKANATFIAAVNNAYPALIALARRTLAAEAELSRLRGLLVEAAPFVESWQLILEGEVNYEYGHTEAQKAISSELAKVSEWMTRFSGRSWDDEKANGCQPPQVISRQDRKVRRRDSPRRR